jgi:hypothetical protein
MDGQVTANVREGAQTRGKRPRGAGAVGTILACIGVVVFLSLNDNQGATTSSASASVATVPYPVDDSNSEFASYSTAQQTAYVNAYHMCDNAQKDGDPQAVTEFMLARQTSSDPLDTAEYLGCSDGNSETPLAGSGVLYPSDDAYGQ